MKQFMTVAEVAEFFGVSRWMVYRWALLGKMPSFKLGRRRLFDLDALERWTDELVAGPQKRRSQG